MNLHTKAAILCLTLFSLGGIIEGKVKIKNNKYTGLVIAINPEVPEDPAIIDALKSSWTDASRDLFRATNKRAYFEKITILVPKTWTNGNYDRSDGESYKRAEVVVAHENPAYGEVPYTLQYGECGEPGSYIHLTPNYLLDDNFVYNYGPRGKTIVHEWAHFRWGVFDEVVTNGYDPFYLSYAGKIEANRCPVNVRGDNYYVNWDSQSYRACDTNQQTMLPEDGCIFFPDESRSAAASSSMMSYQYLDSVYTFCHDDTSDPVNLHNRDAPNEHNRLCNLRSTWNVISSSSDFGNGKNPTNNQIEVTTPDFEVVQPQTYQRFVLVLDTSGSMDTENRLTMMRQAASTFLLQAVPTDSEVGMIDFDSTAEVLSEMTVINDYGDRILLNNLLPTVAEGGTSIGSGIRAGIKLLEKNGKSAKGGNLIVLSDGEENEDPRLDDVYDETIAAGVIVNSIAFSSAADPNLAVISANTGGIWYFADSSDTNTTTALTDAFVSVAKVDDGDVYRETFQIYSSAFTVEDGNQEIGRIVMDNTVGNNTVFTFTWSQYDTPLKIVITAPSGCNYGTQVVSGRCEAGFTADADSDLKTVYFPIAGTAETGTWTYFVNTGNEYTQNVVATATSMASDRDVQPIKVESGMGTVEASDGDAIVVYAQVSMGYAPVLNADVTARIERPSGGPVTIKLKDKGAAPDVRKNDGIYSRYFTKYNGEGRYSVQVSVTGVEGQTSSVYSSPYSNAALKFGTYNSNGGLTLNSNAAPIDPTETNTGNFSRYSSPGGFSYNGTSTTDVFRPSKIQDLSVNQNDVTVSGSSIRVVFTAPGDDYDDGTAAGYEIRYNFGQTSNLLGNTFFDNTLINQTDVTEGTITSPQEAGNSESFSFVIHDIPSSEAVVIIAVAVCAYDEAGNYGEVSNVATLNYFVDPLVAPQSETDVELILMIVFICTTVILACIVVFLALQMKGMKKKIKVAQKNSGGQQKYANAGYVA
uniref:calcium-activated chloride channel regulator 3A-1-like n=1 Tax=Styela clava TaxID=7725 RepID=UPI00193A9E26|nr:calcium-activated chloride channel regulator 3A-1-like [Styela clava]